MSNTKATWGWALMCKCPRCKMYTDLTQHPDWWTDKGDVVIGKEHTGLDAECTMCGHRFLVDTKNEE